MGDMESRREAKGGGDDALTVIYAKQVMFDDQIR
jgi:hypothetical protein